MTSIHTNATRRTGITSRTNTASRSGITSRLARIVAVLAVLAGGLLIPAVSADATAKITVTRNGDVRITGTNAADLVMIDQVGSPAYDIIVISPTGETRGHVDGDIRNLTVDTRGGSDTVRFGHPVSRNATIKLGDGQNRLEFDSMRIGGNLRVTDGTGNSTTTGRVRVDGSTTLALGGGHNVVNLDRGRFGRNVRAGVRPTGSIELVAEGPLFAGSLQVTGGNNADTVDVKNSQIVGRFSANTRSGDDYVRAFRTTVSGPVSFRTGAGDDVSVFTYAVLERNVVVNTDAGDDIAAFGVSWYGGRVTANGGAGTDQFERFDAIFTQATSFRGFESEA